MNSKPRLFFHDTNVLINFRLCGEMESLKQILRGKGAWTATIRRECDGRGPAYYGIEGLGGDAEAILGEPMRPRDDEHIQIRQLRWEMGFAPNAVELDFVEQNI